MRSEGSQRVHRASVVVPTYNRAGHLDRCLPTLLAQDYAEGFEILVIDDGSTDNTADVVRRWQGLPGNAPVRYVPLPHGGLNAARNAGLDHAKGEVLSFVDDDVRTPPGWLRAVVSAADRNPQAAIIGGPIRLVFDGRPPRTCGREPIGETDQDYGPVECEPETLFGSNLSLTQAGRRLGGRFDESLPSSGDEEEFLQRVKRGGGHLVYSPDAGLDHVRYGQELHLGWLLRKRYQRGLDQTAFLAMEGSGISRSGELVHAARCLGHAVRHRCSTGLLDAAFAAGRLRGSFRSPA